MIPLLKWCTNQAKYRPHRLLRDLRYTCATILLMAGKHPKFVQEMFGHANISINHAGHLQPRDREPAIRFRGRYGRCALMFIAAALLSSGISASPRCGEIRIDKPMRP